MRNGAGAQQCVGAEKIISGSDFSDNSGSGSGSGSGSRSIFGSGSKSNFLKNTKKFYKSFRGVKNWAAVLFSLTFHVIRC